MGVVCRYFTIFVALNLVSQACLVESQHGHEHDHHSHDDHEHEEKTDFDYINSFLSVKTHVVNAELAKFKSEDKAAILSHTEVHDVVSTLLNKVNCSARTSHTAILENETALNCSLCSSELTDHVFRVLQVDRDDGLHKEEFQRAAVILMATLSEQNLAFACGPESQLPTYDAHLSSLMSGQGGPERLTKKEIGILLDSLKRHYTPQTAGKCFTADTLFERVSDIALGATKEEVQHLSPLILANMLEGYCIGPPEYPNPESFVKDIVALYGHDGVIPLEDFELMMSKLGLGGPVDHSGHGHEERDGEPEEQEGHGEEEDHDHKRKRAVNHVHDHPEYHIHDSSNVSREADVDHSCFSAEELLFSHGLHPETGLREDHLKLVCPALLQQQLSGECSHPLHEKALPSEFPANAYLYGTLSVFVVSLCSVLGGLFLPLLREDLRDLVLGMLIAMAVSTLSGDALVHLIPLATGLHVHETAHDHGSHGDMDGHDEHDFSFVWKTFMTLMSIYAFFLLETGMSFFCAGHHVHTHGHAEASANAVTLEQACFESIPKTETPDEEPESEASNHKLEIFKFGTLPIMILLSDAFHNFCDGLAMGASFAASIGTGLSTSIAVLCHELPHELGDLAILLKSGMKLRWALFLNFLSALTCFLGFFIGMVVGSTLVARQWILSVTAGMFLYVGLVDMMPQILHADKSRRPVLTFVLQNAGFLVGAFAILSISFLEEAISINL